MGTKRINLKVPEDLYAWVKFAAEAKGLTMTEFLNRLLERKREEELNDPQQY